MAYDHISGHGKDGVIQKIHCEFTEDEVFAIKQALKTHYLNIQYLNYCDDTSCDEAYFKTLSNLMDYFEIEKE